MRADGCLAASKSFQAAASFGCRVEFDMRVEIATATLACFLALARPGLCQDPNQGRPQPSSPQTDTASVEPSLTPLPKVLLRLQTELKLIAEDIRGVEARMLLESGQVGHQGVLPVSNVHALLRNNDPATLIRDFFRSSEERLLFESCLKSAKLYRNLAAEIIVNRGTQTLENNQTAGQPALRDEFVQSAQLVFLSRMIPELELQYGEFQSHGKTVADTRKPELWHKLRGALRRDDQLLIGKLNAFLSSVGEAPNQFAAKVLSQAQKTSPSAAATIVKSMAIISPAADVWTLADVPGINPEFLSAIECENRVMHDVPAAGFRTAFLEAFNCLRSAGGSSVQAFTGSQSHLAPSIGTSSKTVLPVPDEVPSSRDIFRLPTEQELQDLRSEDP